jgi:ribosomal protein S21
MKKRLRRKPCNIEIEVIDGNIEKAIKKFKSKYKKSGIKELMREKAAYVKPSEKRHREKLRKKKLIKKNKK